jgi:thiamine pyrophosphate-dependent acetolactate synthase large subunit-like protein
MSMRRSEVMSIIARHRKGIPAVAGPGATSGTLWASGDEPATIYNMEMGYAIPICVGVALSLPDRKVLALEGEGSAVLGMPAFATVGRYGPENLVVIVFDNEVYGTGQGEVRTATAHGTDLVAVAAACGITRAFQVTSPAQAEELIARAFAEPGPWVLVVSIGATDTVDRPRPRRDHVETASDFRRELDSHRHP